MVKSKQDRVADEWAKKIATVGTVLGRLQLLSSLRDPHTGTYIHHGMSASVGNQTHDILLNSHIAVFGEWQALSLGEQMHDLKAFVASLPFPSGRISGDEKSKIVLETWTELEWYRTFVPLAVSKLERELFSANLTSMIAVLKARLEKPRQC